MLRHMTIDANSRIVECDPQDTQIFLYIAPDDAEKKYLIDDLLIDEHTLNSALDPDELARMEYEPEHIALIFKRPKNYSSEDNLVFRVASTGLFLFEDRLIIVLAEDVNLFQGRHFARLTGLHDITLKMLYNVVFHFNQHLRAINMISGEIEQQINTSLENKYLLNMFTLEKSLVYYLNAVNSNRMLSEKLKLNAGKIGFSPENLEFLDDVIIETTQCSRQANIYSNILASLMDARASIVANNLNQLIKTLTIITIALMLPTLVVSIFSMNVPLPIPQQGTLLSFWFVFALSIVSAVLFWVYWHRRKL